MRKSNYIIFPLLILLNIFVSCKESPVNHPTIYVKENDRTEVLKKIEEQDWAKQSYQKISNRITPYVLRHMNDPEWITSRLSMYWKEGERFTQCYINKNQDWDYGTGNAPVPTVRFPGMRRWNNYINVPLENRIPYSESGDMLGIDRSSSDKSYVKVPYKKSGHMIRYNNLDILKLGEEAAFLYWLTKDDKYAKFAADIYWTWILGTYYMEPPLDPNKATKGPGGYEPGGILGYYDVEQIHDNTQVSAAVIYDFLYYYLQDHPHEHLKEINKSVVEVSGVVFKRYIDLGLIRGGKRGNWNVNGFKNILNSMLVLEPNDFYKDGKGKDYYIPYYTEITTDYHAALPDIMKVWDEKTGLWPESPGYASGMIPTVFDMGLKLYNNNINTMGNNPMILKAVLANLNWLDARGNLVVFGDMRGGPFGYDIFEDVMAYYVKEGNQEGASQMAAIIQKGVDLGQHQRDNFDWKGISLYQPLSNVEGKLPFKESVYSERHRHVIQKNGNDADNAMMFTLYGGDKGAHLSANGLAMQLYSKGWAISPKSSAYESYWTEDFKYFSGATGSNTVLPGYSKGEIVVNGIDPEIGDNGFYNTKVTSKNCSFTDISASEKRRLVAMIRTSENAGYYVDIFRSDLDENDYLYHNLGNDFQLYTADDKSISTTAVNSLGPTYHKGYTYFKNPKKANWEQDFKARWTINAVSPSLVTDMWMVGQNNRSLFQVEAPAVTLRNDITPQAVNSSPEGTPTLIVRQNSNALKDPFVAVFESYFEGESSLVNVSSLEKNKSEITALQVESKKGLIQNIISSTDNESHKLQNGVEFNGIFGVTSFKDNQLDYLYLGKGKRLTLNDYTIASKNGNDVSAELRFEKGQYYYSSNDEVIITIKGEHQQEYPAGYNIEL
ncbi:hypothetical protein [Flammeovirga aprica]|uniref:Endo-acting ulvan lyase C-terminal domain-containing protein n=1 Tax=Flammeovirga aprica JL-4 TaxID=694437 RepID=A0A7X9RU73_9BACT|nr:hypothetical protein [Flammeovirga aprica]NME68776.1 hypothetical protein [Flammeovirga aprica JL-4]